MADIINNYGSESLSFSSRPPEQFANLAKQALKNVNSTVDSRPKVRFTSRSKEEILNYLRAPETNAKNLRDVSIYMFNNSTQYRRLIQYYAYMPLWAYTMYPMAYNPEKTNTADYLKGHTKASQFLDIMNVTHEMQKAALTTFKEGIFYGAVWKTKDSWFIQRIEPDYCELTSVEDGTWRYGVDMSKIKEEDLFRYPPEFASMLSAYQGSGVKIQEVPDDICFCLKADESTIYPIPPFASALPAICDLENYKDLAEMATEMDNYKLVSMRVPTTGDGELTLSWDLIMQFYDRFAKELPPNIGAAAIPMELDTINFERSGVGQTTDDTEQATRNFWYSTCISPLLFGDASNKSSGALGMSIKTDEEISFALMEQCQRVINRFLKNLSGKIKYQIKFLPISWFNQDKMIDMYKAAASLGLPVKQAYSAAVSVSAEDVLGTAFLENEVLDLNSKFIPLKSSHTQTDTDGAGAPKLDPEDLTDAGDESRDSGNDEDKAGYVSVYVV